MKFAKTPTNTTGYQTSAQQEKDLEFHFYSMRCFNDLSIKLDRNHIPLHPKLCINTQSDYDYYIAMHMYLRNQVEMGFKAKWLVTLHYQHPTEHAKPFKETDKPFGFGDRINFKTKRNVWFEDALYKYWDSKRNDNRQVVQDVKKIKCRILRYFYQVKRLNKYHHHKYQIPNLYFFNEQGKTKLQYHTHIVLPDTLCYNNQEELYDVFNTTIKNGLKCTSRWKDIDVRPINNTNGIFEYLNKETKSNFLAFDFENSNPITPEQHNAKVKNYSSFIHEQG